LASHRDDRVIHGVLAKNLKAQSIDWRLGKNQPRRLRRRHPDRKPSIPFHPNRLFEVANCRSYRATVDFA
jgi:hypothetical protein